MARVVRQTIILLVLAILPALCSGVWQLRWQAAEPLAPGEIQAATVRGWGDQVQWVDARPRDKFDAAHIEDALLLNEDEWSKLLPAFLDAWDPDKALVVYCDGGSCEASHRVAQRLRDELKIGNVHVLKGGLPTWLEK